MLLEIFDAFIEKEDHIEKEKPKEKKKFKIVSSNYDFDEPEELTTTVQKRKLEPVKPAEPEKPNPLLSSTDEFNIGDEFDEFETNSQASNSYSDHTAQSGEQFDFSLDVDDF